MTNLDSDLLRTFLAIAGAGSVTGGAARIHRSQSATSLQLKQLEAVIGQPLLARHGRGVALTPAGERLLPVAREVTGALDAALADFRTDGISGRLRIGLAEDLARGTLPRVLNTFSARHPRVELDVQCALGDGFPSALARGALDLAVYEVAAITAEAERLRAGRLVWMAARDHDTARRDPLPVAVFDRACWWREAAFADLASLGRAYRTVFSSESTAGVRAAVASGMAVALLNESAQGDDLIPLTEIAPPRGSYLVLDIARGVRGDAVDALCRAIRTALSDAGL